MAEHPTAPSSNSSEESVESNSAPFGLEYAWKYFEIHTEHRTKMLNFLLVTSGILAYTYAHVLTAQDGPVAIAVAVSSLGASITLAFGVLEIICIQKIDAAKRAICTFVKKDDELARLLNLKTVWPLRDRYWALFIEVLLFAAYLCAAFYAIFLYC